MEDSKGKKILKELYPYVVIIIVVVLIRSFIITPVQVDGLSMKPTLDDNEILLLKKYDHSFERFDVVVFDYQGRRLIKENFVRNSETLDFKLEDIEISKVPKDCYFVMGDNRGNSTDSRIIGVINKDLIKGSTNFSIFPFNTFGKINK